MKPVSSRFKATAQPFIPKKEQNQTKKNKKRNEVLTVWNMPQRYKNALGMIVGQERPEILPALSGTATIFNPNRNPLIKKQYFFSIENSIAYLNKFANPFEEMRRLLCEETIMIPAITILYFFNNTRAFGRKGSLRYRILLPHERIPQFQTILEFIRCIPNYYTKYNKQDPLLNLLFHLFSRKTSGLVGSDFTSEQLITLSEELLLKGYDINYMLTEQDPNLEAYYKMNINDYYLDVDSPAFIIEPNQTAFTCGLLFAHNIDYLEWLVTNGAIIRESDMKYLANFNSDYGYSRNPQEDALILAKYTDEFRRVVELFINNGININKQYYLNVEYIEGEILRRKQTILNYKIALSSGRPIIPTRQACIDVLRSLGAKTDEELGLIPVPHEGGRRRRSRYIKRSKRVKRTRKITKHLK